MVAAGHLEFRKGVGTFVRGEALENDLRARVSFTHTAAASGRTPTTRVLFLEQLFAGKVSEEVRVALNVKRTELLLFVERVRLANDEPVILERRHLLARLCPGLGRRELSGSLYEWFAQAGVRVTGADQRIRAVKADTTMARALSLRVGAALLQVYAVGRSGVPLWVEDTFYRGDRYEFHNVLAEGSPPHAARAAWLNSCTLF